ncbi:hypothetical protein ETAA8_23500 [Anatilimnocola aggregata]|uniref:DUF2760 domain-containing protein n=1 Tax=Anatilimnocola aggregata TaxID=2528021 RepID=A0A517YAK4_9BACT|nr:DUF2760 domain-containing protein [Anatilimnocola aggregata]QDU27263.1 hypothetical protein ETAA8_23500 [Anatilimnocola aggregata]
MGRIGVAFRAFFKALFDAASAARIDAALAGQALPAVTAGYETLPKENVAVKTPSTPKRSEALTLLAALQREARLIDLIQEPLGDYSDEQIGAAARNVLRDSAGVIERFFALKRVTTQAEGDTAEVPAGYDPARYRLVGNVAGNGPYKGSLTHAGWEAKHVNLPAWTGSNNSALVVAPAEVEI